jgi:hypothetical protein
MGALKNLGSRLDYLRHFVKYTSLIGGSDTEINAVSGIRTNG